MRKYLIFLFAAFCFVLIMLPLSEIVAQESSDSCLQLGPTDESGKGSYEWIECPTLSSDTPTPTPTSTPSSTFTPTPSPTNTPTETPEIEPSPTPEIVTPGTPVPTVGPVKVCTLRMTDGNYHIRSGPETGYTSVGFWFQGTERTFSQFALTTNYLWAYSDNEPAGWSAVYNGIWFVAGTQASDLCVEVQGWPEGLEPPEPFAIEPWIAPNKQGVHLHYGAHCDALLAHIDEYGIVKGTSATADCIRQIAAVSPDTFLIWRNWTRNGITGDGPYCWGQGDPVECARYWFQLEYDMWVRLGLLDIVDLFEVTNELGFMGQWEVDFWLEILRLADEKQVCLIVFSDGYGNPSLEDYDLRRPVLDYMLEHQCQPNRRHALGGHSYGYYYAPESPWTFYLWRTLQSRWANQWGTDKYNELQWFFTEFGVRNTEGEYLGRGKPDCPVALAEISVVLNSVYNLDPSVVGMMIFSMGNSATWLDWGECLQ